MGLYQWRLMISLKAAAESARQKSPAAIALAAIYPAKSQLVLEKAKAKR